MSAARLLRHYVTKMLRMFLLFVPRKDKNRRLHCLNGRARGPAPTTDDNYLSSQVAKTKKWLTFVSHFPDRKRAIRRKRLHLGNKQRPSNRSPGIRSC